MKLYTFQKHKAPMRIIVLLGQELYGVGRDKEKQNFLSLVRVKRDGGNCLVFWQLKVNASKKTSPEVICFQIVEIKALGTNFTTRKSMFKTVFYSQNTQKYQIL